MKKSLLIALIAASTFAPIPTKAEFGNADFPAGTFDDGHKSYHDAWCRKIKTNVEYVYKERRYGLKVKEVLIDLNF